MTAHEALFTQSSVSSQFPCPSSRSSPYSSLSSSLSSRKPNRQGLAIAKARTLRSESSTCGFLLSVIPLCNQHSSLSSTAHMAALPQQQGDVPSSITQCYSCINKSLSPSSLLNPAPGPLYALKGCNHHMCRSCLTIQYTENGDPQTFCACNNPADLLVLPDTAPYLSPAYTSLPIHKQISNTSSHLYAANTAISIDPIFAQQVFETVRSRTQQNFSLALHTLPADYLAQRLLTYIGNWPTNYLTTPEFAAAELKLCLEDIFYTHMVRLTGSKYHALDGMFGDDKRAEMVGKSQLIAGMRRMDFQIELAFLAWEFCLQICGAVLGAWWWDAFPKTNGRGVALSTTERT